MSERTNETGIIRKPCGTWEHHLQLLKRDPDYRKRFLAAQAFINRYVAQNADAAFRLSPAVIPVVVHVVYNTAAQNLSGAAIQNQIDALNRDYSRANTEFLDVGGGHRHSLPASSPRSGMSNNDRNHSDANDNHELRHL